MKKRCQTKQKMRCECAQPEQPLLGNELAQPCVRASHLQMDRQWLWSTVKRRRNMCHHVLYDAHVQRLRAMSHVNGGAHARTCEPYKFERKTFNAKQSTQLTISDCSCFAHHKQDNNNNLTQAMFGNTSQKKTCVPPHEPTFH